MCGILAELEANAPKVSTEQRRSLAGWLVASVHRTAVIEATRTNRTSQDTARMSVQALTRRHTVTMHTLAACSTCRVSDPPRTLDTGDRVRDNSTACPPDTDDADGLKC